MYSTLAFYCQSDFVIISLKLPIAAKIFSTNDHNTFHYVHAQKLLLCLVFSEKKYARLLFIKIIKYKQVVHLQQLFLLSAGFPGPVGCRELFIMMVF